MEGFPRMKRHQGLDWLSQLPEDVLWTVLGFLDLPTTCTARLVCKCFRKSAAGRFKALDCTTLEDLPTTDFTQFSGTTHFAVTLSHGSPLQALAQPRISPVITHVSLKGFHLHDSQIVDGLEAVLTRLPKLRLVSLEPLKAASRLPLFPATLEELKIPETPYRAIYWREQWDGLGDASPLTRYSQLTSLTIDLGMGAGTSLGSLSSLRNLRSLDLRGCSSGLGPLSTFTALTSLTFKQRYSGEDGSIFQELGRLTGLSRLALEVWLLEIVTDEDLACIAQLTSLTCLVMSCCTRSYNLELSTALVSLTRLVSVRFNNGSSRMPQLSLPQIEALQSLDLGSVSDVAILGRASGLTHLGLSCEIQEWETTTSLQGFHAAVAGMSMLRSLEISVSVARPRDYCYDGSDEWPVICLDDVLPACTTLTKLVYEGKLRPWKPERDLEACAALPRLRSLSLADTRVLGPRLLPALQAMSGLTELSLLGTGIHAADMTPDVIAGFDAVRRRLGWPLLKIRVSTSEGGCYERL